ncbi:hypothetical protein DO021_13700 [Desulfobacter hydrogenophilus]|uniref:YfiR family protein n=1 Tax=Desulfobacter hydrogenophilus TaxID=2291 RepID=A0A328FCG5_9BACT|nr:YfiR family protein [Desulfobacter hydrogenophilus]NDY72648.1 YfiR family protein [Desulfobacter hydrogenophilus]QBH14533.1 YfiR family protein [Desulfobacter hydrogenophilus]RAM01410.1 hypothetical protein DO021_13700 [Desulfobacter hydrogenophilus]
MAVLIYLYNFSKFIRWPAKAFNNEDELFVIGVVGKDAFLEISAVLESGKIGTHDISVRYYSKIDEIKGCHLLYIHQKTPDFWQPLIRKLKNSGTVMVGEASTFARQGGMIQFMTIKNKLRFIINFKAVKAAGFDLDSRLLSLALELIK